MHADPAASPGRPSDRTLRVTRETGLYECASLFVRRDAFDRAGGFEHWLEARLGKALAEDAWLGWRLRRAGARSVFCEEALVHHAVFDRGPGEFVAERARLAYFPAIAARMPELRRTMTFRPRLLSARSAAFDAALAGAAVAAARRSRWPLVAALPWAAMVARAARPWRRRAPAVAATEAAADAVGFAALALAARAPAACCSEGGAAPLCWPRDARADGGQHVPAPPSRRLRADVALVGAGCATPATR